MNLPTAVDSPEYFLVEPSLTLRFERSSHFMIGPEASRLSGATLAQKIWKNVIQVVTLMSLLRRYITGSGCQGKIFFPAPA